MREMVWILLLSVGLALAPAPVAFAQQDDPVEDAGFLENLIQNALGGEGRTVRVSGLDGVLSSEASIALIEISDADGPWLRVTNVVLDWRRLALLRGRLEVNALRIDGIDLLRTPLPGPEDPAKLAADLQAQPEPFALPDLPVSVDVAELSVAALRLGEPILGQAMAMELSGAARLAGGEGSVTLSADRIDGHASTYLIEAGYTNANSVLVVDLDVNEAADGVLTTLAGIPGSPSLTLTVKGEDPVSDFTAALRFATDDVERLAGTIALRDLPSANTAERIITVDVAGDVADLFLPNYRDFFGSRIALELRARQGADVGFDIEALSLVTRGLQLNGMVDLSPAFLPQTVDITARLGTDLGLPVVLPLPGAPLLVHGADLDITYDEAAGDTFSVALDGTGFMRADGLLIDAVTFQTKGQLTKTGPTDITAATARMDTALTGFSTTDEALWDAIGDRITLAGAVDWVRDGALTLSDFAVRADDMDLDGGAVVTGLGAGAIAVSADLDADIADLSRFAAISGQTLGGSIDAAIVADYDTVSGAFDVALDGTGRDLIVGDDTANGLLTGQVDIGLSAARTADGLSVDRLRIDGDRIDLTGQGGIDPAGWPRAITLTGRIGAQNGAPVVLPAPGPRMTLQSARIDGRYDPAVDDGFTLDLTLQDFTRDGMLALERAQIEAAGLLRRTDSTVNGGTARITAALTGVTADDPDLSAAIAPGVTFETDITWDAQNRRLSIAGLDLRSGDLDLTADTEVTDLMTPDMAVTARLDAQTGPLARFAPLAGGDLGGSATARGTARYATETGFFDVDMQIAGDNLSTGIAEADQLIRGTSRIMIDATRDETGLNIAQADIDTGELTADLTGGMRDGTTTLNLSAVLRDVGLFAPGFSGPLTVEATARQADEIWSVDGGLTGPGGSQAQVSGVALRPDGTMALDVTGALPLGLANRFVLPRTVAGTARFDLAVNGPPGLNAVTGTITVDGARLAAPAARLALEDIDLTVALASARAQIDLAAALSSGGRITVNGPVGLTGAFPADLDARLIDLTLVDPSLYELAIDGQIAVNGPLTGGALIAGRIDIGRSTIKIPDAFGDGGAVPGMTHLNEPATSLATRRRAGLVVDRDQAGSDGGGGGPVYRLDVVISAPQEIFVRGRGLDVELGGRIAIGGTTAAPDPRGGLELIRGRLDLLSQRLEFDTAQISLQGDLDPDINMIASSTNGGVRSQIVIEGPVSDPEFRFTSEPELPEDEVLAQLFFGKSVQDLTPIELAQLASAINRLQGGGGGVFGFARDALGVDDLSVATDDDGNTSVTAGRYISERVYTDVTVGSDGTSEVQLNYEINNDFSARGRFDNEGETGIGLVFERDY